MSITKEQQQALDDALVPREQHLRIGNCNFRLSTTFKPKEPTFQVALDVLSLAHFYQAFLISASVHSIYMHEFWATGSFHKEKTVQAPKTSLGVLDVPTYGSADEQISWKSSDDEDDDDQDDDNADDEDHDGQDDVNEQTESDNDGDEFVHPKLSSFDEEERHEENLDEEEEGSDQRFHTQSHLESTNDEAYNEVTQGDNVEEEKLDEEKTNDDEEVNELYNDVNINLEGKDTKMIDALLANSSSVTLGFISKMLNPNPDTSIDSILNLITKSTYLVDVPVTTNDEIPLSSITTLPPPPIHLIQPVQQTSVFIPTIAPSTSIQNLLTFGYDRVIISISLAHEKQENKVEDKELERGAMQTSGSGISILLTVAFIFRQWEVPSGSGNFLTNSGNALCILFLTILP
nr:hypothetical protein [Tanacetum cinerariifolium]